MQLRRSSRRNEATRQRIIHAAERIFARKGFRDMTLRDITRRAGVNVAAVNYHFGGKDALFREMVRARFEPINRERLRRLDTLAGEHSPHPIPLRSILDALYRPLFEAAMSTAWWQG